MTNATPTPTTRRLERGDGPIGGVAAGLADYFDVDPTLIRLGLAAGTLIGGPVIPICYLAGWIIIPRCDLPASPPMGTAAAPPPVPPAPTVPGAPTPAPYMDEPVSGTRIDEIEVDATTGNESDRSEPDSEKTEVTS